MSKMLKFLKADWGHQVWSHNFIFLLFMLCAFIVVPLIYNYVVYLLAKINRVQMAKTFGNNSQVVIGGIGNIIHEAEILVIARIGGHNLKNAHFYAWRDAKKFRNTISVDHNWVSHNLYQSFFDYFLGFLPAYCTALLLWGAQSLLGGNTYHYTHTVNLSTIVHTFFNGLNSSFSSGNILEHILYFIIVIVVASTAFSITEDSLRRAYSGIFPFIVVLLIVWIGLVASTFMLSATPLVWGMVTLSTYLLGHVMIYLIVIFCFVCIFTVLNKVKF